MVPAVILNELAVEICKPQESLKLLPGGRSGPLDDSLDLVGVSPHLPTLNDYPQEPDRVNMEFVLLSFSKQVVLK